MLSLVDIIKKNNIKQIVISYSLDDNKYTYFKNINLQESKYNDRKKSTLFWGVYSNKDINKIYHHNGPIYIFWGGNDICANGLRLKLIKQKLVNKEISCHYYSNNKCLINLNKYFPNNNFININNNINVVNNKQNLYFLCTSKNSGDYNTAFDFIKNIDNYNSIITYINEISNIQFKSNDLIVYMDESLCRKININIFNKINCIKIAWVRNWERKWLEYLKLFDYVLCCTNKAKTFIESNGIKSYILPIGGNFNEYNFSQNCEYDILIDVNLKNKRKIINNIIGLVKINKYKIAIIGEGWNEYLSKDEFNLIKKYYKGSINYDEIKNYYLRSKIIIDDCNINTEEFGSVNKRVIDVISCKRLVITNNKVGNDEIFDNTLPYYDSFETLKNVITSYINDNKKYNNKVNQLYKYANKFINNDKYKHVFTNLPLFQKNNVETDLVIKICGRGQVNFTFTDSYQWGDLFMAANIRNELFNLYGLNCQICLINDWYNYEMYNCNNVLFLRGISIYNPKSENNNMVLFISHPESYTDEEFKKYNKIICCSKVFYEKIKTNLKLNEDDIIFALQPIAIPDEVKTDKEIDILYDAIFVGNKMRERESISWLTEDNLNKVTIFGNMWENKNIQPIIPNIKLINYKEITKLYLKSKIILNDTWKDMRNNGFVNNRTLEGLVSNNFVLTDNIDGLEDFNNIILYKNKNNLNKQFNNLLNKCKNKNKNINKYKKNMKLFLGNNLKIYNFINFSLFYDSNKWLTKNGSKFRRSGEITDFKIKKYEEIYNKKLVTNENTFYDINKIKPYEPKKKVGVVITTHGDNGIMTEQLIKTINKFIGKNKYIILFINEKADDLTFDLDKRFKNIELVYIKDQWGGLTRTWNLGIDKCFENNCEIIILANNDIFITPSISHIIEEASNCKEDELYYYGPVTNNPGPDNESQYSLKEENKKSEVLIQNGNIWNLNGFFMVFPKHVLIKNKLGDMYFDHINNAWYSNETEWFHRFLKIGGKPIIVYKTFVYHYKLASFRKKSKETNNICMFSANTGGYELSLNITNKFYDFDLDILYFTDNLNLVYDCIQNNIKPFLAFYNQDTNSKLIQRTIKTSCHKYLPLKYMKSIWFDGNVLPLFTNDLIFDLENYEMICCRHPNLKKTTVKQEIEDVLKNNLVKIDDINIIKDKFKKTNFKDNVGLTETSLLIRKHTKNIIEMNNEWTKLVGICIRDQISFDFLKDKYNIKYKNINPTDRPILKVDHGNIKNRTCN